MIIRRPEEAIPTVCIFFQAKLLLTMKLTPLFAGSPPASPQGRKARLSDSTLTVRALRKVISRKTPSPPTLAPPPPEPRRRPKEFRMTGYLVELGQINNTGKRAYTDMTRDGQDVAAEIRASHACISISSHYCAWEHENKWEKER